jgi:hypothetical protein
MFRALDLPFACRKNCEGPVRLRKRRPVVHFCLRFERLSGYYPFGLRQDFEPGVTMKHLLSVCLLFVMSPAIVPMSAEPQNKDEVAKMTLKVGDKAPDFTLLSDQWKTVKLSDYLGKKNVFLAVYVLAFTGG